MAETGRRENTNIGGSKQPWSSDSVAEEDPTLLGGRREEGGMRKK